MVDNSTPIEGDTITYTVMVGNAGPDWATRVQVNDLLPAGVSLISAVPSGSTTYNAGTGTWNIGSLGDATSETLRITATVNSGTAGTTITNVAEVSASDQADPDSSPNKILPGKTTRTVPTSPLSSL